MRSALLSLLLVTASLGQASAVRAVIERAVSEGQAAGAVFLTESAPTGTETFTYGLRAADTSMTLDTVFDCASLTKVVATTTCIMQLVDRGRLRLDDRVVDHLPGFGRNGKDVITIELLLLHRGGLLPDNALADYQHGYDEARRRIFALGLRAPPGTRTIYTDVGYIVLGWIIEKLTGQALDERSRAAVFAPLEMTDTRFVRAGSVVSESWAARCAPTEPGAQGEPALRGVVHDPRARLLDGVAGHAGMFSTATDLRRFGRMLLRGGVAEDGTRLLSTTSVGRLMSLGAGADRALGWRLRGSTAWHTGFTGTAMWMDQANDRVTVLMTSRLYPDGLGDVRNVREEVAQLVGCGSEVVDTGVDVLARRGWPRRLRGARVGLITNHTGKTRAGTATIDVMRTMRHVKLVRLFSPEHGIRGELDSRVDDSVDQATGLRVVSLYGKSRRRPPPESLEDIDTLVFDIQDIGTRFYTYISTMTYAMEAAAEHGLRFVVLDRPNPIRGSTVSGPIADASALDFVGCLRIPIRHGMTVGEIARLARADLDLDHLSLTVVRCEGWWRDDDLSKTGLPWVNPSPNMRSLEEAYLYPGIGIIETTNVSVGRGTTTPFEIVGAPWMDGPRLAEALRAADLPGLRVEATEFRPDASKFRNERCSGVRFTVTDTETFDPLRLGLTLASTLVHHHGDEWDTRRLDRLLKNRDTGRALLARAPYASLERGWLEDLAKFKCRRLAALLYPGRP